MKRDCPVCGESKDCKFYKDEYGLLECEVCYLG